MKERINFIFKQYFDWLELYFGTLAEEAIKADVSPRDIAADYLSNDSHRESFQQIWIPAITSFIDSFWSSNHIEVTNIISQLPGLQARFGGDIGPQAELGIIQRAGLYFDTLVVPDPLLRASKIEDSITKHKGFYLLKYVINQLLLKDFYLSEAYPPIAILTADTELARPDVGFSELSSIARIDTVLFLNELFDEDLVSFDEARELISKFDSAENMASNIVKPDILLFDDRLPMNPLDQIGGLIDEGLSEVDPKLLAIPINSPQYVIFSILGRFMQANDVFARSLDHHANPLISAPVSFHWLSTKINLNKDSISEHLGITNPLNLTITNSLLKEKLSWLSNIPHSALIQLRERGELSELRSIISGSVEEYTSPDLDDMENITNRVDLALSQTLKKHQDELISLDSELLQDLSLKIPTLLSTVLVSIQPSFLSISPSLIQTLGITLGSTNLLSIIGSLASYFREKKKLNKQPIAFLWSAKD